MHPYLVDYYIWEFHILIPSYPILAMAGIILAGFIYFTQVPDIKTKPVAHIIFFAVVLLAGLIGGRISQFVIDIFIKRPLGFSYGDILKTAGSTVTGGILFATTAALIYARFDPHRIVTWHVLDVLALSFPFGHMLGRLGCFAGGCGYGKLTDPGFFTVTYPENWIVNAFTDTPIPPGPRIASPLIAAAGLGIIGIVLFILLKFSKTRGHISALYFLLYGPFRFIQEFTRGDLVRGMLKGLSTGQWFGIVAFCFGFGLMVRYIVRRRRGVAGPPYVPLNGKAPRDKDAFE